MNMSEDLYRKFEKNVRQNLNLTYVSEAEAKKEKTSASRLGKSLKQEKWEQVSKSGGKIDIVDLANVDGDIAANFSSQGLWTVKDVFDAYSNGQVKELAEIAREDDGTFSEKKAKAIDDAVLAYPGAPSELKPGDIAKELKKNFNQKGKDFTARRGDEIVDYLGRLGLDGSSPFMVKLQDEGYQLTHEAARKMAEENAEEAEGVPLAPQPMIMSMNKAISGFDNFKELAANKIFSQGIKDAMKNGIDDKEITNLIKQKAFSEQGGIFDQFTTQDPQFSAPAYRKSFIKQQLKSLLASGDFITDAGSGIRPSDAEMARYVLSTKGKWARVGKTNNFAIPSIATFLTADKIHNAKNGQLVFQVAKSGDNYPIRMTGQVKINSEKDIPTLVNILGTNPKNGFAPLGYDHDDKIASTIMNTFTVFATIPTDLTILEPPVKKVENAGTKDIITIGDADKVIGGVPLHLWIRKPETSTSEVNKTISKAQNDAALEQFGIEYADLDKEQKKRLVVPEDALPDVWGSIYEYAGSMCEVNPARSSEITRLRMLKSDIETATPAIGDITNKVQVNQARDTLIQEIDAAIAAEKSYLQNERPGTLNTSAIPNCMYIPPIQNGKIEVFNGTKKGSVVSEADFIMNKLSNIITTCDEADDKESCFLGNVAITQNRLARVTGTRMSGIESSIYKIVDGMKTNEYKEKEQDFKRKLQLVERKIRTGNWTEETPGKEEKVKEMELANVLDRAKLLGHVELDIGTWGFLKAMKKL